jgi:hypothetical protein
VEPVLLPIPANIQQALSQFNLKQSSCVSLKPRRGKIFTAVGIFVLFGGRAIKSGHAGLFDNTEDIVFTHDKIIFTIKLHISPTIL